MLNKLSISIDTKRAKAKVVSSKVEGIITKLNDEFKVIVNGILYDLTADSFSCLNRKVIYPRNYETNKVKVIRLDNEMVDNNFYVPFKIGSKVVGDIIDNQIELFKIKKIND